MNHVNVGLISGEVKKVGRLPVEVSIITDKSGVCTCPVHGGKGENLLGKAWMKVRAEYQDVMGKDVM